jgi:hypothetical protein
MEEFDLAPFVTDQTRVFLGRRLGNPKVKALLDAGIELLISGVSRGIESPFRFPSADAVCTVASEKPPFSPEAKPPDSIDGARWAPGGPIDTPARRSADNAFKRSWPRLDYYRADLATYALTMPSWFAGDEIGQIALEHLTTRPEMIDVTLERLACEDLKLFEDSLFRVQLVMQAMAPDEAVIREAIDRMYQSIDDIWLKVYRGVLKHYDNRLRPDITEFDIAHILTATAEGIGLRRLVQFDDKSIYDAVRLRSLLGKTAFAVFTAAIAPEGDDRTLAEFFRETMTGLK